jgi:cytochrome P450
MTRIAMRDFIFSDGTRVPAGEAIQVIAAPIHHDPRHYPDPLVFNPWRFSDMADAARDEAGYTAARYDMVTTSRTFLTWGLGKHAW